MLKTLESLLQDYGFGKILLKITPDIFAKERSDVLQYVLGYCGFTSYAELSCYIDFDNYNKNLSANFSHGQKENLKYASKNDMLFTIINSDEEICIFYDILKSNLLKFNVKPVHSVEELLDFKNNRLKNNIIFYGIFIENRMISGGMIFNFGTVMHTQYLATDYAYIKYRPMTFLYYKLIELAQQNGYRILSWGISTEERGTILNENLLTFKESFGSKYALNRGFYKTL
jgi:lipid II:glycine glycyltransferase (peptidoglycan interpeptide bridge formation enzyme)